VKSWSALIVSYAKLVVMDIENSVLGKVNKRLQDRWRKETQGFSKRATIVKTAGILSKPAH